MVTHSGDPLVLSNSFRLFNAGAMTGTFASFSLPPLSPELTWSLATLHTDGWLRVVSNTPPAVSGVAISGSGMVVSGSGGAPGALYHVIASTNVALPAISWQPVATNLFDASGNFVFTNPISPALGGQFLRLRVP
jgi:hypothetical protein